MDSGFGQHTGWLDMDTNCDGAVDDADLLVLCNFGSGC